MCHVTCDMLYNINELMMLIILGIYFISHVYNLLKFKAIHT